MTTSNIILMEYSAQQRCFHYNYREGDYWHNAPKTNGYIPLVFIDDTAAYNRQFNDETNDLIGLEPEDILEGVIDCLQRLGLPYKTIQ